MKLSWTQIKVFGLTITLPLIVIIVQKLNPEQVEQFRKYRAEMAECPACHRLFSVRAGMSFMLHLQDIHKVDSGHSMDIVGELYKQVLAKNREHRAKQHEASATN